MSTEMFQSEILKVKQIKTSKNNQCNIKTFEQFKNGDLVHSLVFCYAGILFFFLNRNCIFSCWKQESLTLDGASTLLSLMSPLQCDGSSYVSTTAPAVQLARDLFGLPHCSSHSTPDLAPQTYLHWKPSIDLPGESNFGKFPWSQWVRAHRTLFFTKTCWLGMDVQDAFFTSSVEHSVLSLRSASELLSFLHGFSMYMCFI